MRDLRSAARRGARCAIFFPPYLPAIFDATLYTGSSLDAPLLASSGVQATIEGDAKAQKRSLIVSMLMLLISIPTLIGA